MNEFTVGDILRYYRHKNSMTQAELAEAIGDYVGVNAEGDKVGTTISRMENNHIPNMKAERAFKAAKILHMTSQEMLAFVLINSTKQDLISRKLKHEAWNYFLENIDEKDLRAVRSPHLRPQASHQKASE